MTSAQTASTSLHQEAFVFIQALAQELSAAKIDIPSFPDIAVRVRRVLADESVTPEKVSRVVSAEPALAARLLQVANSAALNVSGKRVTELRTAIARIGFNIVRSAAIAFAMSQLKKAEGLKGLEQPLDSLWQRSAAVAAMCYVVAKRVAKVNPDTAMLAGLLHGMGKLYILVRASSHRALFSDATAYNEIVRDWHTNIAKAILENWEMTEEVVAAVHLHEDIEYEHEGPTDLTDVLIVANLLVAYRDHPDSIELNLQGVKSATRMQLDPAAFKKLIAESGAEIEALRSALGS